MHQSKEEIIKELRESYTLLSTTTGTVKPELFNVSRENKWTTAENIRHLVTVTKMTTMAFAPPKLLLVLLYGKPGRTSHPYKKLVDNYQQKLAGGAKASGAYIPKKTDYNQQLLSAKLTTEGDKLINAIETKWSEQQLDHYQVKHPILGLLTLRELAYFTIYHNGHHLATIQQNYLAR